MGMSFTQCRHCGVLFERHLRSEHPCYDGEKAPARTHYVIPDIQPYQAMAVDKKTGVAPMITSRREHNEFLKRNDFVCIGNEAPTMAKPKDINVTSRQELSNAINRVAERHGIRIRA
jgi:hypothetical protein